MTKIQQIQTLLGVTPDGIWGPMSQGALNAEIGATGPDGAVTLAKIQAVLGVDQDGKWGVVSQAALNAERATGWFSMTASSFADPADVAAFNKCKAQGFSDTHCFGVGDNGVGEFGDITAQEDTPFVAVNHDMMIARWGSEHGAAHRDVEIECNGQTFQAKVGDRISAPNRIDFNPAAVKLAKLRPPVLAPCRWRWL